MASMEETGSDGLETWELLQTRQLQLALKKRLQGLEAPEETEEWETNLDEAWESMKLRLENQLRSNALDHENKPFSLLQTQKGIGPDGKTTAGVATNIIWKEAPVPGDDDGGPQNSDHLMSALKLWGLELPNMTLVIHGGSSHPWQLIRVQQLADQRADFLKSRPRFDVTYFDGQRDPAAGWMAAGNQWRYPAFYVSPAYNPSEFTFRPPHTLFIDAALQVQEDHELIETGDRTINEWIMDAVTHQPISRQAAIKGADGVFYWDLNAPSLASQGALLYRVETCTETSCHMHCQELAVCEDVLLEYRGFVCAQVSSPSMPTCGRATLSGQKLAMAAMRWQPRAASS